MQNVNISNYCDFGYHWWIFNFNGILMTLRFLPPHMFLVPNLAVHLDYELPTIHLRYPEDVKRWTAIWKYDYYYNKTILLAWISCEIKIFHLSIQDKNKCNFRAKTRDLEKNKNYVYRIKRTVDQSILDNTRTTISLKPELGRGTTISIVYPGQFDHQAQAKRRIMYIK